MKYISIFCAIFFSFGPSFQWNLDIDEELASLSYRSQTSVEILSRLDFNSTSDQTTKGTCYPFVGCFDNKYPFNNALFEIPQNPEKINTKFILFTQESQTDGQLLFYNDQSNSIKNSQINSSRWLRFVVHGFINNVSSPWVINMKDELLKLKNTELSDVILVDWGNGAKGPIYPNAAANTRLVARQIGLLLEMIQKAKKISYDKVHCIGHSLGAHTCALASNIINNQIARISGLDPAGPLFEGKSNAVKLDPSDAKFIDVIHSNADFKFGANFGSAEISGHVDFYVNGGEDQPGCSNVGSIVGNIFQGQSTLVAEGISCSHSRSHEYFIESINSLCPFTGFRCGDYASFVNGQCSTCTNTGCGRMGFHSIDAPDRGRMYLLTDSKSPFCGYQYLLAMKLSSAMKDTEGEISVALRSNNAILANISLTTKAKTRIVSGDEFRRVFLSNQNLDEIDSFVVYFNKEKNFFEPDSMISNEIRMASIRLNSLDTQSLLTGNCESDRTIVAENLQTIPVDRSTCAE